MMLSDAQKLLDPAIHIMMESVHRFEGTVNQVLGDGIRSLLQERRRVLHARIVEALETLAGDRLTENGLFAKFEASV